MQIIMKKKPKKSLCNSQCVLEVVKSIPFNIYRVIEIRIKGRKIQLLITVYRELGKVKKVISVQVSINAQQIS